MPHNKKKSTPAGASGIFESGKRNALGGNLQGFFDKYLLWKISQSS